MTHNEANKLKNYCLTKKQEEVFELLVEGHNHTAIAALLNYGSVSAVGNIVSRVKTYAAKKDILSHDSTVPEGFAIKGTSTLYDSDGNVSIQWVKTDADKQAQLEAIERYISDRTKDITPILQIDTPTDQPFTEDLTVYPVADAHIGVYTSEQETGVRTNLEIQSREYREIITKIVTKSDSTKHALIAIVGDFFHANDATNSTPAHKHVLDVSARGHEIWDEAESLVRHFVEIALTKHEFVHIRLEEGNHDPDAIKYFRFVVRALYRDNPRVITYDSAENFHGIQFGNTLHVTHHGHRMKPDNVIISIIEKFRSVLHEVDYIYVHSGHWHNNNVTTKGIVRMETHATFAPNDDYAAGGGWCASKFAVAITYSRESGGELNRCTASILKRKEAKDIACI